MTSENTMVTKGMKMLRITSTYQNMAIHLHHSLGWFLFCSRIVCVCMHHKYHQWGAAKEGLTGAAENSGHAVARQRNQLL